MKVLLVAGTRPELIKLSRVFAALDHRGIPYRFLHTGQHWDDNMALQFIRELELPVDYYVTNHAHSGQPVSQTAHLMIEVERSIIQLNPTLIVVQGDTNTTLAAAIAAAKHHVPIAHIEAGLRSYDWRMPEEHNRRIVDHIATLLFAPTMSSQRNLLSERVCGRVYVTGNTVIDAILHYLPIAERSRHILETLRFDEYILATFHRAENVDNPDFLAELVCVMEDLSLPVVIPLHPRTLHRLREHGFAQHLAKLSHKVQILPPLGYFDFLLVMKHCRLILTDSGGLQEEATAPGIQKMTIIMRTSTERPEAIEAGYAQLGGVTHQEILDVVEMSLDVPAPRVPSPFGDGRASGHIVSILEDYLQTSAQDVPLVTKSPLIN